MKVNGSNPQYSIQGNPIGSYGAKGSIGKALREICLKIIDLMKRTLLFPVQCLKRCFSGKKGNSQRETKASYLLPLILPNVTPACQAIQKTPQASPPISFATPPVAPRILRWPQPFNPSPLPPSPRVEARVEIVADAIPPAPPSPQEFKDFLRLVKPLDQGVKTALSTLCEETDALAPGELERQFEAYRHRLLETLTPDTLKTRKDYITAIRTYIKTHPQSGLFPCVGLKEPNSISHQVPRILASVFSPVLAAAFQQMRERQMREGIEGIYSSPHFADGIGGKVADFLKTGVIYFDHIAQAIDLYETSHQLELNDLQQECRKKLIQHATILKPEELEPLWAIATFYEDAALQFACIQNAKNVQMPPDFQQKRTTFLNLTGSLIGAPYFDGQQHATTILRVFDSSILAKCQEIGIESVQIMYATPQMDMEKLRSFKCLDLDYQPDFRNSDQAVVKAISSLLKDNRTLTELKLRLPQLSAEPARQLVHALQKSSLKSFELRFCQMDAEAVSTLSTSLAKNQKLEKVTLRGTGIGEQGLQQLAEGLKNNIGIRQIGLPGCKIEPALPRFKESLKSRLPKLEIVV